MSVVTAQQLAACHGVSVVHRHGSTSVAALVDVHFSIEPRERVSLLGASGSGKTTLLHVLGGLIAPNAGDVWWCGARLSSLDAAARGQARSTGIAFVFQGANLLPGFTAFENVAFARHVRLRATGPADHELDPAQLLTLVGLADKLDALPGELSGGEAQRVAIARALAQRPRLLLCDEPTGQLDRDTGSRVLDLIGTLHERFGFALLTATHDPELAARSDRSVALADGRIVSEDRLS